MPVRLLSLLLTVTMMGKVVCEPDCSFKNLLTSLGLTNPPQDERPTIDWRNVTKVYMDLTLYTIVRLDMSQQTVVLYLWLNLIWQNDFATWDPDDFCGIKSLYIPSDYFWQPVVYIYEMVESDNSSPVISYYYLNKEGETISSMPLRVVSTCNLNLFKFPFDIQTCRLTFGSYVYSVTDLIMLPISNSSQVNKKSQEAFASKGDWKLISVTVYNQTLGFSSKGYSQVIYEITIQRQPIIYLINLIIPACFFVFLDIASMLINSYGDKLAFKINIILGFSVLLLILNNILPESDITPMLGIFYCTCLALMVLSIIGTICSSYMLEQSANLPHVPPWIKTLVLHYLAYMLCFSRNFYTKEQVTDGALDKGSTAQTKTNSKAQGRDSQKKVKDNPEVKLLKMLLYEILKIHQELTRAKNEEEAKSEWSKVMLVIDRLILILYFMTVTAVFIIMIVVWSM